MEGSDRQDTMRTCPAKIRPFPNDTEVTCDQTTEGHRKHSGVIRDYAYPGSETILTWQDDDRRNFTGDWIECPDHGCTLPAGHRGDHAP